MTDVAGLQSPVRVAVCVATFARPEGLARVLDGMRSQLVEPPAASGPILMRAVVVDNDATGPARAMCEARSGDFPLGLRYNVEPTRGISFTRNRLVAVAGDDVDFIAMLDDDEVPEADWLATLVRVQGTYEADIVSGPVIPYFPVTPAAWIQQGRFFDRPRYPTGQQLQHALTGNALIRRRVFETTGLFNARFALTGGSDLQFFRRAAAVGCRIVWADEARVDEWVPPSRANLRWLLRRAYRSGSTLGQIDRDRPDALRARVLRVARGAGRMAQGLVLTGVAAVSGGRRVRTVAALMHVWKGAGMIAGVLGGRYEEYRVVHPV